MTSDGENFYSRCVPLLTEVGYIWDTFAITNSPKGQLRVDLPVAIARSLLVPHLATFKERYPNIELVLSSTDRKINLVSEGVDCVIRIGTLEDSSLVSKRIGMCRMMTCASPAYLAKFGVPENLDDLNNHVAVNFFKDHRRNILEWRFDVSGEEVIKRLRSGIVVDNSDVFVSCGLSGHGLMQGVNLLFEEYLATGALVEVLPNIRSTPKPVSIVYPARTSLSTKVTTFVGWATELGQTYLSEQ
jgi:DNA-binding transcriptional LysR family regulator